MLSCAGCLPALSLRISSASGSWRVSNPPQDAILPHTPSVLSGAGCYPAPVVYRRYRSEFRAPPAFGGLTTRRRMPSCPTQLQFSVGQDVILRRLFTGAIAPNFERLRHLAG